MSFHLVEVMPEGEVKTTEFYTRQDLMRDLGISSPTISRYIRLISKHFGISSNFGFERRSRVFTEKQKEILAWVNDYYRMGLTTSQVDRKLLHKKSQSQRKSA